MWQKYFCFKETRKLDDFSRFGTTRDPNHCVRHRLLITVISLVAPLSLSKEKKPFSFLGGRNERADLFSDLFWHSRKGAASCRKTTFFLLEGKDCRRKKSLPLMNEVFCSHDPPSAKDFCFLFFSG